MTRPRSNQASRWWVVTDLDGTLMDHNYNWSPAEDAMRWLQSQCIPLIACTSKTAEEVRRFRLDAGIHDPFIVENGGAIHGESPSGEEWELSLGPECEELRLQLQDLQEELGEPLLRLDELSDAEGVQLLGLSGDALHVAQRRRCSVPFVPPSAQALQRLSELTQARQLTLVKGNRMAHLLGPGVSKGQALQVLKRREAVPDVQVLALGDSPNDIPLLEEADVAVVVPGPNGPHAELLPGIHAGRYHLARAPHAAGWAEAVQRLIS